MFAPPGARERASEFANENNDGLRSRLVAAAEVPEHAEKICLGLFHTSLKEPGHCLQTERRRREKVRVRVTVSDIAYRRTCAAFSSKLNCYITRCNRHPDNHYLRFHAHVNLILLFNYHPRMRRDNVSTFCRILSVCLSV